MEKLYIFTFGLSQLFGLFLFILAIALFSRRAYYRKVFLNTSEDNPIIMLTAVVGLFLGIILIGLHGGIIYKYRLIITILCWLIFVNSLFWLMIPEKMLKNTKRLIAGKGYSVLVFFLGAFGFWLLYRGGELFLFLQG